MLALNRDRSKFKTGRTMPIIDNIVEQMLNRVFFWFLTKLWSWASREENQNFMKNLVIQLYLCWLIQKNPFQIPSIDKVKLGRE